MGLAEVLVAGAVGGVIIAGSMKSLQLSLQSAQVVKSSLSESDLHHTIRQVLSSKQDCLSNFKPTGETIPSDPKQPSSIGLYGADREWGVGEVVRFAKTFGNTDNTDDEALLKKGVAFKGDLSIVKMELKGQLPSSKDSTTKLDKKPALRTFVVYYKKEGMGGYSTLGGEPCDKDNLQGCYFNQCKVELRLDDSVTTGTNEAKCEGMCADYSSGGGGGSGNPDCYKVDKEAGKERTLVGCGADEAEGAKTTAIGYGAGKVNTGAGNTFVGYKTGLANIEGAGNTFIGSGAGKTVTSGNNNIVIGSAVQLDPTDVDRDNQINIGNIIKAEQIDSSEFKDNDDHSKGKKQIGVLRVCNAAGTECLPLSKESFTCPDKDGVPQYFRGFKKDGTPDCQKENFCPQSQHHWTPENICHECPRDSPLYAPGPPPTCSACRENENYALKINRCCARFFVNFEDIGNCPCPEGQTWTFNADFDLFSGDMPGWFHKWGCYSRCFDRPGTVEKNGECVCPESRPHEYGVSYQYGPSICHRCPQNKPHYYNYKCNSCHQDKYYNNKCNRCPQNKPHYYTKEDLSGVCHECPESTPYYYRGECNQCPHNKRHYYNNKCNRCPQNKPHYYNYMCNRYPCPTSLDDRGSCARCPLNRPYNANGLCCPWGNYNANGICCERIQYNDNGLCCLLTQHNSKGKCCPKSEHNDNGLCCGLLHYNSKGKCCREIEHNSNGKCCPKNQHNSNGKCCPKNQHNSNGKCCPEGQYNSNGICCNNNLHNSNGHCCPRNAFWKISKSRCKCNGGFYWDRSVSRCVKRSSGGGGGGGGGGDGRESDPSGSTGSSSGNTGGAADPDAGPGPH